LHQKLNKLQYLPYVSSAVNTSWRNPGSPLKDDIQLQTDWDVGVLGQICKPLNVHHQKYVFDFVVFYDYYITLKKIIIVTGKNQCE